MQIKGSTFYGKRTLYYWAKIFGSQLDRAVEEKEKQLENIRKKTGQYTELNKCIVISLMDFSFFKDERYHRCFMLKDRDTNDSHIDLDYLDLYFVELEKFDQKYNSVKTTLERWISFLNNADLYSRDILPQELAEIEPIKKASERLDAMYLDSKERSYYEAQQKRYRDEISRIGEAIDKAVEEAVEEALQKATQKAEKEKEEAVQKATKKALKQAGREAVQEEERAVEETKLNMVIKLILLGLDNQTIEKATSLTSEEIKQIRNKTK